MMNKLFICMLMVGLCAFAFATQARAADDDYTRFAAFCQKTFGALHEPLTYQLPGKTLAFEKDGEWRHVSEDSAVIAVETNLPAKVVIEYGPTTAYGSKTEEVDWPHYVHVRTLRELAVGAAVHYRVVATDERGNTIQSEDQTFTPAKVKNAVYIKGDEPTPIVLSDAGKTYVLKGDINADGTALSVEVTGVTVDLNGHTITYNNAAATKDDSLQRSFGALAVNGAQGIRCGYSARQSAKVFNGTIRQGSGKGGYGSVPLLMRGTEVAGVTIDYYGTQVSGIKGELKLAHHNVFIDRGSELTNRHQGVECIAGTQDIHHNLILRARQRGIEALSNSKIEHNEIYVDSCATNSFGIMYYKSQHAATTGNRIFGTGYLVIGIGTVSEGVGDIKVSRNFINLQSTAPDNRWAEYGPQSGAYCVRVTWGGENIEYADNVLVSKGRDGGMMRGVWFCPGKKIENVVFRNNTIKVLAENAKSVHWGAIVISGEDTPDVKPGLFENNTIISNFCNVRLGEAYGAGRNVRFVGNTFVKAAEPAHDYATVICGFYTFGNNGSIFLDSKLEGGANLTKPRWEGTGENGYAVGHMKDGHEVIDAKLSPNHSAVGRAN